MVFVSFYELSSLILSDSVQNGVHLKELSLYSNKIVPDYSHTVLNYFISVSLMQVTVVDLKFYSRLGGYLSPTVI